MLLKFQQSWLSLVDKLEGWMESIILQLPNILLATLILVGSIIVARYIKKWAKKILIKTTKNSTITGIISNIITAVFMLVMLFIVLGVLQLDKALTSLLAGAGVIGLAIGLALQDPMVNLFSGVLMSVRDYYQVGDLIETNDYFGRIAKINLRSTILNTPDGQEVIIPNKEVLQNPLKNFSHTPRRRIELSCGVAYNDDLEAVQKIAVEAIEKNISFIDHKPVELFFTDFGDSSINFKIRFWQHITTQRDFLLARSKAIIAIKKAFDKNGISIPFPIRTLDFGVEGGTRIDELYPLKKITKEQTLQTNNNT